MSELKNYNIMDIEAMDDERLEKSESGKIQVTRVYIKSEVDKVIAEKDAEIEKLKAIRKVHVEAIISMEAGLHQDEKKIRRLRRALWLARAYRGRDNSILLPSKFMRNVWDNVERKCKAKAEEFK